MENDIKDKIIFFLLWIIMVMYYINEKSVQTFGSTLALFYFSVNFLASLIKNSKN